MTYEPALDKAWAEISNLAKDKKFLVKFLADEYEIDLKIKKVLSVSRNAAAKDYTAIILLHYLIKKLQVKALPAPGGNWIDFRELQGGEAYYPTFKKRTIGVILRKYDSAGYTPGVLEGAIERFGAKKVQIGDFSIAIEPLENVPVLITLSKGDEEFGPDANILFDENIREIFCTEDIVVLTEIVVHTL